MNKRSAMLIAASLVGVLAIGGTAFALGFTGPTRSSASEGPSAATPQPVIRTHTTTVVVHRQAASPALAILQATASPSPDDHQGSDHENEGPDDHGDDENEGPDDHGDHGNEGPDDHGHDGD